MILAARGFVTSTSTGLLPHHLTLANTWCPSLVSCPWHREDGGERKHSGLGRPAFSLLELSPPALAPVPQAGLCPHLVPGDLLVPRAGWPLCPTACPSVLFPVSPPRNAVVLMFTSVRPQRCQPFLPYLAYLDIYFLRLSVLRVAKPCRCPKQAASALREGESGSRAQILMPRRWVSLPVT